jgi:hypothetical protein
MLVKLMIERSLTIVIHNVPLPPPSQVSVVPPPQDPSGGDTHLLAGKGVGGPNTDEGTDTLVLYVLYTIIPLRPKGYSTVTYKL